MCAPLLPQFPICLWHSANVNHFILGVEKDDSKLMNFERVTLPEFWSGKD